MNPRLSISLGQHSDRGRKPTNQDFHGALIPDEPQRSTKGIALAIADGISSSAVSHVAAETSVASFLADYYCTSDAWSVKKSAGRVLVAINSWLHAQTRQNIHRYERDRGYVCTFSAVVLKSTTAHLFHVGDARIYRLRGGTLEQLTRDHRVQLSAQTCYLGRALGIETHLEIDYQAVPLAEGDLFLLTTDGVHEHLSDAAMVGFITAHAEDLQRAAAVLVEQALAAGSDDNLTAQLVRIERLPAYGAEELPLQLADLVLPPMLEAGMSLDGYRIVRALHTSSRSHVFLAQDEASGEQVALKIPSLEKRQDSAYLERFMAEEWIARRIDNPHVACGRLPAQPRRHLFTVTDFIEGCTLWQWMIDHPQPDLETVRSIVEQIARGLQAFHRLDMLHQDVRPQNLMIDRNGTVKIIDFGSTHVAGLEEINGTHAEQVPGTAAYTAPEYLLGEPGSPRSDQFSLAVIAYQLLSGRLPYGSEVARARSRAAQLKLRYRSVRDAHSELPAWLDEVLAKALHPEPARRFEALSEFVTQLREPGPALLARSRPPLLERNPLRFWQGLSLILATALGWVLVR
ncbi:bifunctional protein-serine/threonine kinase/phosphatase [Pseudomonas balearica]|uniref:bifunctional protein-serine/threonine kinase/phosphatase n=1 Tax=Stutzerimonas balearica TaxID=74829 RepID=UPI001F420AB0|nr:bifunctional protein-serine/threonine kinase/phosphatase [Stutzerimonas balearica]MCF6758576.1 bifunctional protein-serine/threonine kinase/phosphatase [Stutzerimonas balearica]